MISLGVAATDLEQQAQAQRLSELLHLPLLACGVLPRQLSEPEVLLLVSPRGLCLQQTGKSAPGPVMAEFGSSGMRHRRRGNQNEMLGRAVGVGKKPDLSVIDATAGLGKDGFVLADLGCPVVLCERHKVVAELLASGLSEAQRSTEPWLLQVAHRMTLHRGDVRDVAIETLRNADVIYLDPMFPARRKTASVKKEMALFQAIHDVGESAADADDLLLWSLSQSVARVVVKRPAKAVELAGRKPSHVIAGKSVRYDVYVLGPLK